MKTKILGHRGANRRAPQNTIPAFQAAIDHGADGVEFDVQMSSDGVLVICHNFTVDETSDGTGYVNEHTFEELRAMDFGSWFGILNVEIKHPSKNKLEVVQKTYDMVKEKGLLEKVIFSSFDFDVISILKHIDPDCTCGLLYDPVPEELFDKRLLRNEYLTVASDYKADALHPYFKLVNYPKAYIRKCHEAGLMINVWGISKESDLEKYKDRNLDIIITDCI